MLSAAAWKAGFRATTPGVKTGIALDSGPSRAPCTFWKSDRRHAAIRGVRLRNHVPGSRGWLALVL